MPALTDNEEQVLQLPSVDPLIKDVERVQRISILSNLLEVVTLTTGMGFAVIARVTRDRWIACGVRDEIGFGLVPGGELKIETTICDEIREHRHSVIVDHVDMDPHYRDHHMPKIYGIQSYISVPIILKDGTFFGTLCAIDPSPAQVNNPKVIGMFNMFVDLISFHLAVLQNVDEASSMLKESHVQLSNYKDELRQYQHLYNHNLQEPLRKIMVFSDILLGANARHEEEKVNESALKINHLARGLAGMIRNLSEFSGLGLFDSEVVITDLNEILQDVLDRLYLPLAERGALVKCEVMHTLKVMPNQVSRLFYHLVNNCMKFAKKDIPLQVRIYSKEMSAEEIAKFPSLQRNRRYCEICFEDNGIGIAPTQLEKIFDLFSKVTIPEANEGFGVGLAQCRKIVRNHHGIITAHSEIGKGTTFSIILPMAI